MIRQNNQQFNRSPFLLSQREFPDKIPELTQEIFRMYVDVAQKVNARTVGTFSVNRPSTTGESWFITSERLQTQRQLYPITGPGSYPHGIDLSQINGFSRLFGTATDGTNWYPIPYVDEVLATNQISLTVTPTNIEVVAGATAPVITQGYVVLEWIVRTSAP